jgi:hypothetical protein
MPRADAACNYCAGKIVLRMPMLCAGNCAGGYHDESKRANDAND